jgi:hypothetical protein
MSTPTIRVLSLGAGVQSTAVAILAATCCPYCLTRQDVMLPGWCCPDTIPVEAGGRMEKRVPADGATAEVTAS